MTDEPRPRRFLTISQAAEELNVTPSQIPALPSTGELGGIKVGGRGLWRTGSTTSRRPTAEPLGESRPVILGMMGV